LLLWLSLWEPTPSCSDKVSPHHIILSVSIISPHFFLNIEGEFASGMEENEWNGQTIMMGGPGAGKLEKYSAVQTSGNDEWAEGMGDKDKNGETIRLKGTKGMESYDTLVQMESENVKEAAAAGAKPSRPDVPVRGEKQW
jgi:hypothetical protein